MSLSQSDDNAKNSLQMMKQLLPILLYIRNFSEYNRHKPVITKCKNLYSFKNKIKILGVSDQISSFYKVDIH
jgi:hypothetical protein